MLFLLITICGLHTAHLQFQSNDYYDDYDIPQDAPPPGQAFGRSRLNNRNWLNPGQQLVFSSNGGNSGQKASAIIATTTTTTTTRSPAGPSNPVLVNNRRVNPTLPPFLPSRTTPTPQFLTCIQNCPTTSEHNPICASNREQYGNEQKFNCARNCGAGEFDFIKNLKTIRFCKKNFKISKES